MRWQRWTKRGVGTILAALAILLTAFPLPALPLRWLPAGAALVLAIMLFWEQRPVPDVPLEVGSRSEHDPAHSPTSTFRCTWLRTVSYTHLRAHETRHDLVCRL